MPERQTPKTGQAETIRLTPDQLNVWDTKRQIIWLSTAVIFGTLVVYQNARDEAEGFDPAYFALLEVILLI
ncbi:MAG: hypothetical protein LC747_09170, partial [Acidobacteria bacterium]|nr:hypothetical protein [Acidobacteriota bacterium]